MRAVCYMRTSTKKQDLGFAAQRRACVKWAKENDVEIVEFFEERVSGGATMEERKVLTQAIASLGLKGADYLLAAKRDRLSRTVFVHATLQLLVTKANPTAKVVIADGNGNGDSVEDTLMANMLAAFSQYERDLIKMRIQAAIQEKQARGERLGSPPYGWKIDRGTEDMTPKQIRLLPLIEHPGEQATLARMVEFRNKGISCEHVARLMNTAGYRARRGKWHTTSVIRAIKRAGEFRDQRKKKAEELSDGGDAAGAGGSVCSPGMVAGDDGVTVQPRA